MTSEKTRKPSSYEYTWHLAPVTRHPCNRPGLDRQAHWQRYSVSCLIHLRETTLGGSEIGCKTDHSLTAAVLWLLRSSNCGGQLGPRPGNAWTVITNVPRRPAYGHWPHSAGQRSGIQRQLVVFTPADHKYVKAASAARELTTNGHSNGVGARCRHESMSPHHLSPALLSSLSPPATA